MTAFRGGGQRNRYGIVTKLTRHSLQKKGSSPQIFPTERFRRGEQSNESKPRHKPDPQRQRKSSTARPASVSKKARRKVRHTDPVDVSHGPEARTAPLLDRPRAGLIRRGIRWAGSRSFAYRESSRRRGSRRGFPPRSGGTWFPPPKRRSPPSSLNPCRWPRRTRLIDLF